MTINFVPGNIIKVNQAFVQNTLSGMASFSGLPQTLESLGNLDLLSNTVLATGNLTFPSISFIRVVPNNTNNIAYNEGDGVTISFPTDSDLNNSFILTSSASPQSFLDGGLTQTLYVDLNSAAANPDGSISRPYPTIQAAINVVPINTTIAEAQRQWSILIAPGSYDEDITKPAGTNISLIGLGPFNIGTYTGTTPTSIRNVTLNYAAQLDGLSESFTICTLNNFNHTFANSTALVLPRITGNILANSVTGAFGNLQLQGRVEGGIDASGFAAGATFTLNAHYASVVGATYLPGTNTRLLIAEVSTFLGLVTTSTYLYYIGSTFRAGLTCLTAPNLSNAGIRPAGMMSCDFAGVLTGPANSAVFDTCTNDTFVRNGASLGGSATKILRGGIERTRLVTADPVLTVSNDGQTILADTTTGAFPITLPTAVGNDDLYFTIKNVALAGGFAATITPTGGQLIDGAASLALAQATNDSVKIVANGGNWWVVSKK